MPNYKARGLVKPTYYQHCLCPRHKYLQGIIHFSNPRIKAEAVGFLMRDPSAKLMIYFNGKSYYWPKYIYESRHGKIKNNEVVIPLDGRDMNTSEDNLLVLEKRLAQRTKLLLGKILGHKNNPMNRKSAISYWDSIYSPQQIKTLFFAALLKIKANIARNKLGPMATLPAQDKERQSLIIDLYSHGKSFDEIAKAVGLKNRGDVSRIVSRYRDGYYETPHNK